MNKISKLKENLSLFWNTYKHMEDGRTSNTRSSIGILMILSALLAIFDGVLYNGSNNIYYLVPIIFQFTSLLVLMKSFFITKGRMIPWVELTSFLKQIDDNSFTTNFIAELKAIENQTYVYLLAFGRIIKTSLYLLIGSVFLTILVWNPSLYSLLGELIAAGLIIVYYKLNPPVSKIKEDNERFVNEINGWLIKESEKKSIWKRLFK